MEGQSQNATEQAASSLPQEGYISRPLLTLRWFERKSMLTGDNRGVPSSSSSSFSKHSRASRSVSASAAPPKYQKKTDSLRSLSFFLVFCGLLRSPDKIPHPQTQIVFEIILKKCFHLLIGCGGYLNMGLLGLDLLIQFWGFLISFQAYDFLILAIRVGLEPKTFYGNSQSRSEIFQTGEFLTGCN